MIRTLLFVSLVFAGPVFAQPAKPDLTLRARAVLRKYCADCHHPGDGRRGQVSVVDSAGLERAERPFLAPGSAKTSQILQLMEDGSMPPGGLRKPTKEERQVVEEWITANAASYPQEFDSAYVMSAILENVKPLPEPERQHFRYFSLHNAIPAADPAFALEPMRDALRRAVAALSKKGASIEPVDAFQSVFRVDLRQAGWDLKPFKRRTVVQGKAKLDDSDVNLFDLILIEYPLGRLDTGSEVGKQLTDAFLKPAAQAVPTAFIRGDWFVDEFATSTVARDFVTALELAPPALPARVFAAAKPEENARGKKILPLDSVIARNTPADDTQFRIIFETRDSEKKVPKSKFRVGDRLDIHIRPNRQVFVEVVWHNADGTVSKPNLGANSLIDANQDKFLAGGDGNGFLLKEGVTGKEYLTIFASEIEFPPGDVLKSKENLTERVMHPFYSLPGARLKFAADPAKFEFDPAKIVKKTIEIEILPKEKK